MRAHAHTVVEARQDWVGGTDAPYLSSGMIMRNVMHYGEQGKDVAHQRTRISSHYGLALTQGELDFVDVDVAGDTPLFISPGALRNLPSEWGHECVSLLQSYFGAVIGAIRSSDHARAKLLLRGLREPNETRLGLSKGLARGRALGSQSANEVWEALLDSEAVHSGLLEDLEDSILMIEGIGPDIVSDMVTNVIRGPLIAYTQEMCDLYGIPMTTGIPSGPMWDPVMEEWQYEFLDLPITDYGKLIFVPKVIVRRSLEYDEREYFNRFVLSFMQQEEIRANTELVHVLKNGSVRVTKKDVKSKYGQGKRTAVTLTKMYPQILAKYREHVRKRSSPHLSHEDFRQLQGLPTPPWDELITKLRGMPAGTEHANDYHALVQRLLTALFYPSLTHPRRERSIHSGRKRIDISYDNCAQSGFFLWLANHYCAPHVFVECKNYSGDPVNPELDQLAGRFSPSRGQVGFLVCRRISDRKLFSARCRDTAMDGRGWIIALDDSDLLSLIELRRESDGPNWDYRYLKDLFDVLIM